MRFLVLNLACLISGLVSPSTQVICVAQSIEDQLDRYIAPFDEAGHFSGVVLVAQNGEVVYEKGFGLADFEHEVPNRLETRFGVASLTKPMTAVILLRLLEKGNLSLEDKLSQYVPDFPRGDEITIEMLARHRSGIPHRVMPEAAESVPHSITEMVESAKQASLEFKPGNDRLYSSAGYTVLTRVLEIASGNTYQELLDQHVFQPAGMEQSVDFDGREIIKHRADDYLLDSTGVINAPHKDLSFLIGAGSVLSTAGDIYRFARSIFDGKLGEQAKATFTSDGVFSSNGSTNGFRAYVRVEGETGNGYVLLANINAGANDMILNALAELVAGNELPQAKVPDIPEEQPLQEDVTELTGTYQIQGGNASFEVMVKKGHLWAGNRKLIPAGKDRFFDLKDYGNVQFSRDDSGQVTDISWTSPAGSSVWEKQSETDPSNESDSDK